MIYIGVAGIIFLIDFFVKKYIDKKYEKNVPHDCFFPQIEIRKYYNKGAAFNLGEKNPKLIAIFHTGMVAGLAIREALLLKKPKRKAEKLGIALILGGGMSNLYDRLQKKHVVDYVRFRFGSKRLQNIIFNISDFFIFAGVIIATLFAHEKKETGGSK